MSSFDLLVIAALLPIVRQLGYAVPLVVSVSLVYAATRHELYGAILRHAARVGVFILLFLAIVFVVLQVIAESL